MQVHTLGLLAVLPVLLLATTALYPELQRALYAGHPDCPSFDGSPPLCLLPAEWGTSSIGRGILVYSKIKEKCGPETSAVIQFSRNAWYRVGDATKYLQGLGYNVSVGDLSGFTIQVSLVTRIYRRTSETVLPNGTVIRGEICEEVAKKTAKHFVLILGNMTSNTYFALKLRTTRGLEEFVDASPIVLVPKTLRSVRNASGGTPLAEFLKKRYNLTLEDAEQLSRKARERLLELKATNKAATTLTVDELGLTYDVLELVSNIVAVKQFVFEAPYYGGAAGAVAKVTVWYDLYTGRVYQYRDDG